MDVEQPRLAAFLFDAYLVYNDFPIQIQNFSVVFWTVQDKSWKMLVE